MGEQCKRRSAGTIETSTGRTVTRYHFAEHYTRINTRKYSSRHRTRNYSRQRARSYTRYCTSPYSKYHARPTLLSSSFGLRKAVASSLAGRGTGGGTAGVGGNRAIHTAGCIIIGGEILSGEVGMPSCF